MSSFGTKIHINLFGESHGKKIGIVINNLPAGIEIDLKELTKSYICVDQNQIYPLQDQKKIHMK
jgi:hypothetical protein